MNFGYLKRVIVFVVLGVSIHAEEAESLQPETQAKVMFLALGARPEIKYTVNEEDERIAISSIDDIPPNVLLLRDKEGKRKKFLVGFNAKSLFYTLPAEQETVFEKRIHPAKGKSEKYFTLKALPSGSKNLVVLQSVKNESGAWAKEPKYSLLDVNQEAFKKLDFVVKNFSKTKVNVVVGDEIEELAPDFLYQASIGEDLPANKTFTLYIEKEKKRVARLSTRITKQNIHFYAIYDANPKTNRGRDIGVVGFRLPIDGKIAAEKRQCQIDISSSQPVEVDNKVADE